MAVHDWTRVEAGVVHDQHYMWCAGIKAALMQGLLPEDYCAMVEQHAGRMIPDVLTLHVGANGAGRSLKPLPPTTGGTAVAEAPPRVRRRQNLDRGALARRRTIAVRHVSEHRLVALIEVISPANKDRRANVEAFAEKVLSALQYDVHVLLVDVIPPGPQDPNGMHGATLEQLGRPEGPYDLPPDEPLTVASYVGGSNSEAFIEHFRVGSPVPDMPLFLSEERYVTVPLDATYEAAFRLVPSFYRDILESRP